MSASTAPRRWGTIPEAASHYGVSRDTIRRMIARGDIYAERVTARLIRVDLNSLHGQPLGPKSGAAS